MRATAALLFLLILLSMIAGCDRITGNQATENTAAENPLPAKTGFVSDHADVFSPEEKNDLESILAAYEKETCHQILVLTVAGLYGEPIAEFSARTAMAWDIGQDMLDNGVLITLAMEEGSIRIEAGAGLEFLINDGIGDLVLAEEMIPLFKEGNIVQGINRGISALMEAARARTYPDDHRPMICR